jgi:zinc protease
MRVFVSIIAFFAIYAAGAAADISDQVFETRLDNGMQVVVIQDNRAPVVTHMVWYRAGSADETAGVSGVAHFLEHLLFKKTKNLADGELSRVVAENGGSDNAFTSYDYTAYYQRIASDRLGLMMSMESDRMVNLDLDPDDIYTERDVIIEERNQRTETNPNALFREQFNAALYQNHRYGVPVIGWRHEMSALELDDALAYYRQFYAPNNAILIVAGDVDPQQVFDLAQTYYGPIPANPNLGDRTRPQEPPHSAARRLQFYDERVAQPYVVRSYLAPERDSGDQHRAAALTLLADVLGGSQTSVLVQKLQFDDPQAIYVSASYSGVSLDRTTFDLVIVPAEGVSLQQAEDALDAAVADFIETGIDAEQLARIKGQYRASQIYARDSVTGLARSYGRALTSGLTIADVHDWPDILQSVTAEDIVAAARDVFDTKNSVTGWVMAKQQGTE